MKVPKARRYELRLRGSFHGYYSTEERARKKMDEMVNSGHFAKYNFSLIFWDEKGYGKYLIKSDPKYW